MKFNERPTGGSDHVQDVGMWRGY